MAFQIDDSKIQNDKEGYRGKLPFSPEVVFSCSAGQPQPVLSMPPSGITQEYEWVAKLRYELAQLETRREPVPGSNELLVRESKLLRFSGKYHGPHTLPSSLKSRSGGSVPEQTLPNVLPLKLSSA